MTKIFVGVFEGNRPLIDEYFQKLKTVASEQLCEIFASKISEYQTTNRYEQKEYEFQYECNEFFEEVG